jgi:LacI family transcriptional regulator, galactose operon repressor
MDDLARATGLSKMTVSRALNDSGYVSAPSRKKVLAAARQLNYRLNYIGRNLNQNRTGMLGIITPLEGLIGTYYFGQVVKGVQLALVGTDYHIAHYDSLSADFNDGQKCAQLCYQKRVDGLIVIAPTRHDRFVKTFADLSVPLVVVGGAPRDKKISYIDVDNFGGASAVIDHLIGLGHRKIGFVAGPKTLHDSCERELAFRKGLARRGIRVNEKWVIQGSYETRKAFHAALHLLSSRDRPTAVFAANDLMALGVLDAARILGISVPQELSIAGFDDIDAATGVQPPITTVRQPMQRMGKKAVEYILELVAKGNQKSHLIHQKLTAQLIVRQSTGPLHSSSGARELTKKLEFEQIAGTRSA